MRCDEPQHHKRLDVNLFQSLSGFLMRCDVRCASLSAEDRAKFQSLSGFLMRCD